MKNLSRIPVPAPLAPCLVFLVCTLLLVPAALGQEGDAMPQEVMAAWAKAMTPGEPHTYLAKYAGDWNFEATFWMAPGAPPNTSNGTSEKKMLLGGRYLQEIMQGKMMGEDFEGHALTSYDNAKGGFTGSWVDNMSTGMMVSEGEYTGNSGHTLQAEYIDPVSGQPHSARMVTTIVSPDHHIFEYYTTPHDGEEFKSMVVEYRRQK